MTLFSRGFMRSAGKLKRIRPSFVSSLRIAEMLHIRSWWNYFARRKIYRFSALRRGISWGNGQAYVNMMQSRMQGR